MLEALPALRKEKGETTLVFAGRKEANPQALFRREKEKKGRGRRSSSDPTLLAGWRKGGPSSSSPIKKRGGGGEGEEIGSHNLNPLTR